ncbi:Cyclic di-GMP phosphodiesterase response regulator RpfG [Anaerolineales bacterium]|nr:Cyclic di-GMP phosphodiesterase response regulator RpfG [Anaerolineales bacterium]
MRQSTENELNALSSWLLGITGVSLILVPFHFGLEKLGLPPWTPLVFGGFCYLTALSNQLMFVVNYSRRRALFQRSMSIFLLFGLTLFMIGAGYFIEGSILGYFTVGQLIINSPLKKHFEHTDPLQLIFVLAGLSSGIYLAISGNQYDRLGVGSIRNILAILFLAASIVETIRRMFFGGKLGPNYSRLQVIPWVVWCLFFLPTLSVAHLIAPGLLAAGILFNKLFPWNRLQLPENDILGNRAVKITSTLGTTLLIFLSALLIMMDFTLKVEGSSLVVARNAAFMFFILSSTVLYYEAITIIMTINGLMSELARTEEEIAPPADPNLEAWNTRLTRYIRPFTRARELSQAHLINAQNDQISILARQLTNEKKRNSQITMLMELSQQLENQLDQPVAAQLAVNSLERALNCDLVCLFLHEPDQKEFMLLAATGKQTNVVPSGFRQSSSTGALGRAVRQRKTQIIQDTRTDADYIPFEGLRNLSAVIIPLIFNGYVNGAITLDSERLNAFNSTDVWLSEAVAAELTRAWERSRYHQRLMNLVQTGSQLSAMVQPETAVSEVASISREILQARFTYVQIHLGQERNFIQSASSGKAPKLLQSLENSDSSESFIQLAFHAVQPFRIRDIRKYAPTSHLIIDHAGLRSMLAIPIRWHRLSIGAILAFGKQNEVFFNENDQSLAELLSIQAAGAFESTWLQQELRGSLRTTSLLYRLSNQIIQSDNLQNAAEDIAQTAHKIAKSFTTGIMLFDLGGQSIAEVQVDASGAHIGLEHPMDIISDVMESGQLIYISQGNSLMRACLPIQTPTLKYGILWMDIPEEQGHKSVANPNDLQALVNQTAIALERSVLLVESRRQAAELKIAYDKLETTYDQTLAALMSALDARDRETEGHSSRVSNLTAKLGRALNFSHEQLKVLERGSLLHDIGKIGISDTILHKPGPLSEEEWVVMRRHPDIGAKIVEGIPFLEDTIPLIRHHQERWDGTGYPDGLREGEIPILARMFSIVDAFDALTSIRPYRKKISTQEAVEYIQSQAGILFDPEIVKIFERLIAENLNEFSE